MLTDTLAANTTYVLSAEFGDRPDLNNGNPDLRLGLGGTPGANYLTPAVSVTPVTINDDWVTWMLTYTTDASPAGLGQQLRIEIVNQGIGSGGLGNAQLVIDNLQLTSELSAPMVPEPSTFALFSSMGLLLLGSWIIRRARQ